MRSAILFVTDKQGVDLAEHSVAVALLTQNTTRYLVFCVGFEPPSDNTLIRSGQKLGKLVEYRALVASRNLVEAYRSKGAHSHVSSAALLKMSAAWSLRSEFDRALYIDNDVLLMKDFALDGLDFEGAPIAAVYDIAKVGGIGRGAEFHARCRATGLSPHYFNSGVIAVNFSALTDAHVELYQQALLRHFTNCSYEDNCTCDDQCAWNIAFRSDWKRLPLSHNFQACALFNDGWTDATARHYVGVQKFLPVKAWRNDRKDTSLIAEARVLLGREAIKKQSWDIARRLNIVRNAKMRRTADKALAAVEQMYQSAP